MSKIAKSRSVEEIFNSVLHKRGGLASLKKRLIVSNGDISTYNFVRCHLGIDHLKYGDFSNYEKFPVHQGLKAKIVRAFYDDKINMNKLFKVNVMAIDYILTSSYHTVAIGIYDYFYSKSISLSELRKIIAKEYNLSIKGSSILVNKRDTYSSLWNTFVRKLNLTECQLLKIFGRNNQITVDGIIYNH